MTENNELKEQIKIVAEARLKAQQASEAKTVARVEWENQNRELLDDVARTQAVCLDAEAKLRELTLQAYTETGNKAPAPGVSIKIMTELLYNPSQAFEYAKEHGVALKLDVNSFEKMAKIPELRPSFVTVRERPQATIASNLEV